VTTITSAILAGTALLMHAVLEMDVEVRQRTQTVNTIGRLAEQFRRDAHQAAGDPILSADRRGAEFHLPGGRVITWQIDDSRGLIRTQRGAGIPPAVRENTYTLPPGTTAALELQSPGASRIVTLRIDSPGTSGPAVAIEALTSRDARRAIEEETP
jgi:hypothetical protein